MLKKCPAGAGQQGGGIRGAPLTRCICRTNAYLAVSIPRPWDRYGFCWIHRISGRILKVSGYCAVEIDRKTNWMEGIKTELMWQKHELCTEIMR